MNQLSVPERRSRTIVIIATGLLALVLLTAWTVILRKQPIEEDLTARAIAALDSIGIDSGNLSFEGRDGAVSVEAPLASSVEQAISSLVGVRVIDVTALAPPTTTTTTTTTLPAATTTTTTTTTVPTPEATLTLTSDGDGIALSGRLTPGDAGAVVGAAERTFGADRVTDAIVTDPATTSPLWASRLPDAMASLSLVANPGLAIEGGTVTMAGDLASEERRSALLAAFGLLGLEMADGLSIAGPLAQEAATALEQSLNAALEDASILFETGSSEISDIGSAQLDAVLELLLTVPGARVEIGGHTDSEGPADGNLILSQARADAVAAYLIAHGVDQIQVTAVGYGEDQPVGDNNTPEGRAANRRIAFIVEGSA